MIYVECTPDTTLARVLAGRERVEHLRGAATVCNKLQSQDNCKGMVDELDVLGKHPYLRTLPRPTLQSSNSLLVFEEAERHNTLILLRPRLEEWVIDSADEAKVRLQDYGLLDDPEGLHDQITLAHDRDTLTNFRLLIQALQRASARVQVLARLLRA